jgi:kynurenine formamidase
MSLERFIGKAAVLDVRNIGQIVEVGILEGFLSVHPGLDYLLLRTGWEEKWGQDEYFQGFPVFSKEATELLVSSGIKGIGLDTISVDPIEDSNLTLHHILLGAGCIIVENLCNLEEITDKVFIFSAFPLKFDKGDGSPVRAVAIL